MNHVQASTGQGLVETIDRGGQMLQALALLPAGHRQDAAPSHDVGDQLLGGPYVSGSDGVTSPCWE